MPDLLTQLLTAVCVGFTAVVLLLLRISEHLNAIRKNLAVIKSVIEVQATNDYLGDIRAYTDQTNALLKRAVKKLDL
jgi:hypothetical protein